MEITSNIYYVGVLNPNLRVFDVVMKTEYGTSYNSYLICGKEKTALIEGCHENYTEHILENISKIIDPSKIDYIVLNHNEPDHTGSIAQLLKIMPNVEILTSAPGKMYINNICNIGNLPVRSVKDGETIDLGGKTLKFISAPFLHWPDSMFTYVQEDKTLFSCDFLGSHYCEPYILDTKISYVDKYRSSIKNYYDPIFSPFNSFVQAGLSKISDLEIDFACTSHGPVLTKNGQLAHVIEKYNEWSTPHKNEIVQIPIFYTSAYGNTKKLAEKIAEGIKISKPSANVEIFDIIEHDMDDLVSKLHAADLFAIGTPTINKDALSPVWQLLSHVSAIGLAKKPALVFGSYGWSGEGVPNIVARLNGLSVRVYEETLKVLFVPTEEDLEKALNLGKEFAK